jgi:hypothetical protein
VGTLLEQNIVTLGREVTVGTYCNEFAGSISQWKFITLKAQYTTLDYSPQFF